MSEKLFDLHGLSHLALNSADMARTVDFYQGLLGLPLFMTLEVPGTNGGQHFFFDVGRGEALAFFYIPGAPEREVPLDRIGAPFAVGLMNHAAFQVRAEDFDGYLRKIADLGVRHTYIRHDTDNVTSFDPAEGLNDKTFARSVYFADPDGNVIEFCAWLPPYESLGVTLEPASPADR